MYNGLSSIYAIRSIAAHALSNLFMLRRETNLLFCLCPLLTPLTHMSNSRTELGIGARACHELVPSKHRALLIMLLTLFSPLFCFSNWKLLTPLF